MLGALSKGRKEWNYKKREKGKREGERKNYETHTTWGRNSSHPPIGCSVWGLQVNISTSAQAAWLFQPLHCLQHLPCDLPSDGSTDEKKEGFFLQMGTKAQEQRSSSVITGIKIIWPYKNKSIHHEEKKEQPPTLVFLIFKSLPAPMASTKMEQQVLWTHFGETVPIPSEAWSSGTFSLEEKKSWCHNDFWILCWNYIFGAVKSHCVLWRI